jgi:hypothetical protein
MLRFARARALFGLLLSAFIAPASAAVDTLMGTVTDAASAAPLENVSVGSEGVSATTDAAGKFQLMLSSVAIAGFRQGTASPIAWNAGKRSFSWSAEAGPGALVVLNTAGHRVAGTAGAGTVTFALPRLPPGVYLASFTTRDFSAAYRIAVLQGAPAAVSRINAGGHRLSSPQAKLAATGASHDLIFSKAGYSDYTLTVPAGSSTPLAVKLSAAPTGKAVRIFDGRTLTGWNQVPADSWEVKDSALSSLGKGRGFAYPTGTWSHYRIIFSVRQVSGDHNPDVLVFGSDPKLDALGGIQFQLPYGVGWDYRPGHNNTGSQYYTKFPDKGKMDNKQWSRCEILVDASKGEARAACAQPPGSKAVPILSFKDPAIKNVPSYFGLQMHNGGIHDQYKDIILEVNPAIDDLITTK